MSKPGNRLPAESVSFTLCATEGAAAHVTANIGRHPETGHVVEIAFCEAGKIGHGMHLIFAELGLKLSRILQDRDPETGRPNGGRP